MNIEHFIAKRIARVKSNSFTKTITRIAIASTTLSIIVMILSSAILEGFSREIHAKVFGFWGNIHITHTNITRNFDIVPIDLNDDYYQELADIGPIEYQEVDDLDPEVETGIYRETQGGVRHVQPFIIMPGLIETKKAFQAVLFKGVDDAFDWENMENYLVSGNRVDFGSVENEIIISKNLANKLRLSVGNEIILSFIKNRNKLRRKLKVSGIYNTGLEEYDRRFVIGSMALLQQILDWSANEATGIEVFVDHVEDSKILAGYLYENVIPLDMYAETIQDKFPNIFEWLKLQDINEVVIYQLMIIVALINMITIILILVLERSKMIGILKSLGATNASIKKIFLISAAYILGWGLLIGNILGIGFAFLQKYFGIIKLDEANYYLDTAPIYINWLQIAYINIGSCIIILIVLYIPLMVITSITPMKTLRFN